MSIAEYNRIVTEWMSAHFDGDRPCPLCGKVAGWSVLAPVEMPVRFTVLEGQARGKAIPAVPLMCKNCAYLAYFAAVTIGVLPPAPPADQTGESA
jgi:hypothetical protein